MYDLDATIRDRRSVRGFYPDKPVPTETILEVLGLAQHAPSNCNVQPWRVFVASGARCNRLREQLVERITSGEAPRPEDPIDPFEGGYRRLQVECAVELYASMDIARDDQAGRMRALLRNFEFFDAPHVAIICMDHRFGIGVALDVGMYVQNLMLAMHARGIGTCAQASLRQYPRIIKSELQIPDDLRILCGVAFGYEDPDVPANHSRQRREPIEENVVLLES
jgi:nitroreductase